MRAILVFQHMEVAHPGIFREFLRADGIAWQAVRLDRGEPIPDLAAFDALWVMGGAQDVWQEAEHPWLVAEKAAIREAVSREMPFLGICLGHQLLADDLDPLRDPVVLDPEVASLEPRHRGALPRHEHVDVDELHLRPEDRRLLRQHEREQRDEPLNDMGVAIALKTERRFAGGVTFGRPEEPDLAGAAAHLKFVGASFFGKRR